MVINQLRRLPHHAPWGLFSSDERHRRAALEQYRPRSEIGVHLHNLLAHYRFGEGNMAHTTEDMKREAREWLIEHYLDQLDPEERLKGLDPAFIEAWLDKQRKDH